MKSQRKTTRHYHLRRVASGMTPVREHPMSYWARIRDGYKHKLTGMEVCVVKSLPLMPSYKGYMVVGKMPKHPPFDLYEVSGGDEFVSKEDAEKALKEWLAKDSDGDKVKNKDDCDPMDGTKQDEHRPQSAMLGETMIELQDDGKYHVFVKTDDGEEKWIGSSKSFGSAKAILTKYERGTKPKPRSGKRVYDFFEDAGHGWMKVKKSELEELGIADKISSFSYEKGDYAYLEEDADATLFIETLEAKRGTKFDKIAEVKEHVSDTSAVRRYGNYQQPWGNKWLRNDLGYQTIYTKGDKQIKVIDNRKYYHSQGWGVLFSSDLQEPDRTFVTKEEAEAYVKKLIPNI